MGLVVIYSFTNLFTNFSLPETASITYTPQARFSKLTCKVLLVWVRITLPVRSVILILSILIFLGVWSVRNLFAGLGKIINLFSNTLGLFVPSG